MDFQFIKLRFDFCLSLKRILSNQDLVKKVLIDPSCEVIFWTYILKVENAWAQSIRLKTKFKAGPELKLTVNSTYKLGLALIKKIRLPSPLSGLVHQNLSSDNFFLMRRVYI